MPLLVLENANFIIIRPQNYEILKAKYTAKTNLVGESKTINYPVICALKDTPDSDVSKFANLSQAVIKALGFDELKKIQ